VLTSSYPVYNNLTPTRNYVEYLLELLDLYRQHYPEPVAEIQEEAAEIDVEFILEDLPSNKNPLASAMGSMSTAVECYN